MMEPFTPFVAIAAPLPLSNVDTDKIIPARFMKTVTRRGLGINLFHSLRYHDGCPNPDFILNQSPYSHAQILIAYENFGCGSSREHAPWALLDFGIRAIIAPSFADIFGNNCYKNGILPISQPREVCTRLMADVTQAANSQIGVDLEHQVVVRSNGEQISFEIDSLTKDGLLRGIDDISLTLQHELEIGEFERRRKVDDWLRPNVGVRA